MIRTEVAISKETELLADGTERLVRKAVTIDYFSETGELLKSLDLTICTQGCFQCPPGTGPALPC